MRRELLPPSEETLAKVLAHREEDAIARWFGLGARIEDGAHRYRLTFDEPHIGNPVIRALHGGVISAFLEYCAKLEVLSRSEGDVKVRSISVHTSYLRGSRDQDLDVLIKVERVGRRIAFLEARGWQGDRDQPVATADIALRRFEDE